MTATDQHRKDLIASILEAIGVKGDAASIQRVQTRFRLELVETWGIPLGARVLEIGCGQGDTTAVIAAVVGSEGRVTALDPAAPSYGTPVNLGNATSRIKKSPLGSRIDFRLGCDLLERPALGDFDYVVFAHCAWYFSSPDRLKNTLSVALDYAPTLCFSEWDTEPQNVRQLGHMLAAQVLGIVAALNPAHDGNVRTPLARATMRSLIETARWTIERDTALHAADLQDGGWEVANALATSQEELAMVGRTSPNLESFLRGQLDLLREWAARATGAEPLASYAIRASR